MTENAPTRHEASSRWLDDNPTVGHVTVAACDINGMLRGKRLPRAEAAKVFDDGLRMPLSGVGVDIWGRDVLGNGQVFETGDADGILRPTERGALPISWADKAAALLPLWMMNEDGSPFPGDPRHALADIVRRYKNLGLTPVVATELEFYLLDPEQPYPTPPKSPVGGKRLTSNDVLSVDELDGFGRFLDDVYAASAAQGIGAASAISENGCGQFEINLQHLADPLRAADDALFFKRLVKGIARRHGFTASFMAKPYGDQSGSGFHVHFSLLDQHDENIFNDGSPEGSERLRHAVGGLLETMSEATLLLAPHLNSYRRLRPGTHAPIAPAWGYENRTTAIRVPGGSPGARRIEHRVAGADANPYLVIAAILGGALIGLEQDMTVPDPIKGNAYALDLPPLPTDWSSALAAFENGESVERQILNPVLHGMIAACKHQEIERFSAEVTAFECSTYLDAV